MKLSVSKIIPKNIDAKNLVNKGIGATGLGVILYDSHNLGKIEAEAHQRKQSAHTTAVGIENTMSLDNPSIIELKTKRSLSNFLMDEGVFGFFNGISGYFKGFSQMLVHHVVPLGLALGTVATKGKASKFFGAGLLAYGGIFVLNEFLGLFDRKDLT